MQHTVEWRVFWFVWFRMYLVVWGMCTAVASFRLHPKAIVSWTCDWFDPETICCCCLFFFLNLIFNSLQNKNSCGIRQCIVDWFIPWTHHIHRESRTGDQHMTTTISEMQLSCMSVRHQTDLSSSIQHSRSPCRVEWPVCPVCPPRYQNSVYLQCPATS